MDRNHLHILVECGGALTHEYRNVLVLTCREQPHILLCGGALDPSISDVPMHIRVLIWVESTSTC